MIGWLKGKIIRLLADGVIINVHDVGYKVFTPRYSWKTGDSVELHVHTHIREDQQSLFGFSSLDELALFESLLTVSGVGPKAALNILSHSSVTAVIDAIEKGKPELLQGTPGIGSKVATRIVVELKKKVSEGDLAGFVDSSQNEVLEGLASLGIERKEAVAVLRSLPDTITETTEKIRWALKHIGK